MYGNSPDIRISFPAYRTSPSKEFSGDSFTLERLFHKKQSYVSILAHLDSTDDSLPGEGHEYEVPGFPPVCQGICSDEFHELGLQRRSGVRGAELSGSFHHDLRRTQLGRRGLRLTRRIQRIASAVEAHQDITPAFRKNDQSLPAGRPVGRNPDGCAGNGASGYERKTSFPAAKNEHGTAT
jgi:hypothetical protein